MRLRPRLLAALGAGAIVALCSVVVDLFTVMSWYTSDADGVIEAELGTVDADGQMVVDEPVTAAVNACVQTRKLEPVPLEQAYRPANTAERLQLYGWTLERQQPCLAAYGIETQVPPLSDFLDDETVPWYLLQQYIWEDPDHPEMDDFDALLEARLACPPMPAYLAAQGVGW